MSNAIDQRVVEMKFENEQFEKGIASSLESLENLKKGLNTKDYGKTFNETLNKISDSAKNFSLSAVESGIQALQDRFSTLGIIGMRVIQNLTDTMMRFATKTVSFVSDAIIGGGKRRAMNIENAHFQLQGLLKDEERVQAVMDDAMWSVDGTAYAYDEAAKAASQFAASGLEAGDQMRSALRAITGVAAMTNSDYESISRIFTTVAGNGRLMGDNLLSLSSRGLNAAASLAEYFNKVNDGSTEASESVSSYIKELTGGMQIGEAEIREFVSKGKLSFEVFSSAMDDAFGEHAKKANETFTGALSNVKAALARIGAEFISPLVVQNGPMVQLFNALREQINEVKKNIIPLATAFTTSVNGMASAAAKFVSNIDLTHSVEIFYNTLDSIKNIFVFISTFVKPIREAFTEIFPKISGEKISKITASIKDFTSTLSVGSETLDRVKRIFKGVFAVFSIGKNLLTSVAKGFVTLLGNIWPTNTGLLEFLATIGDNIVAFKEYAEANDIFGNAVTKVSNVIIAARDRVKSFIDLVKEKVKEYPFFDAFLSLIDRIRQRIRSISSTFEKVKAAISALFDKIGENLSGMGAFDILPKISNLFGTVFGSIIEVVKSVAKTFSTKLVDGDFSGFFDTLNTFILGFTGLKINSVFGSLDTMIYKFSGFGSLVKRNLSELKVTFIEYQTKLKADSLMKIAEAIGLLALSLLVLSGIDSKSLTYATAAIATLFGDLVGSMSILSNTATSSKGILSALGTTAQWNALGTAMVKMAASVLILAFAMRMLAKLEWEDIAKGLVAVGGLAIIVTGMAFAMTKMGGSLAIGSVGLVIMAAAIAILAGVCKDLSELEWDEIARGLIAVGGLMLELAVFSRFAKSGILNATGVVILVASVKMLVDIFKDLAQMSFKQAEDGLKIMGALLLELGVFTKVVSGSRKMISTGIGLVLLAASLTILTNVLKELNAMDGDQLKRSLFAVALSLFTFAAALNMASGTFGGSMAILVAVAALAAMVPVLKALGGMEFNDILQGLFAIVVILGSLIAAGYLAKPVITVILGVAASVALLGVGLVTIGAGLLLISAGLTAVGVGLSAFAGSLAIVAAGVVGFIGTLIIGILGLIPEIVKVGTRLLVALAEVITNGAPAIASAIVALIDALVEALPDALGGLVTLLAETVLSIAEAALEAIDNHIEGIVDSAISIVIKILNVLKNRVPELIPAIMETLGTIGAEINKALGNMDPMSILAFFGGIVAISLVFKLLASSAKDALKAAITIGLMLILIGGITASFLLLSEIDGVQLLLKATAMTEIILALAGVMAILQVVPITGALTAIADLDLMIFNLVAVLTALGAIYEIPGIQTLIDSGSEFLEAIGSALGGFVGGIVGGVFEGISDALPSIGQNLADFVTNAQPFFEAMDDMSEERLAAIGSLVTALLGFTTAELIEGVAGLLGGKIDLVEFGSKLSEFAPYLTEFAEATADLDDDAVAKAASAASMVAEFAKEIPNEGGLLGLIMGNNDMKTFGENLVSFGPNLKQFADDVTGLDSDAVQNAADCASMIVSFAKEVPNTGGLLGMLMGDNDLDTFGASIVSFGPNLKQFADDVTGLDSGAVDTAAAAADMIIAFAKEIPNSGGLLSWIVGDNKIDTFGEDLETFGKGLKGYSDQATLLNKPRMDDSITVAEDLIELGDKAPSADTTWNLTSLGGRLGGLGGDGTSFGEQLLAYSGYVSSCDWVNVNKATSAVKLLVDKLVEVSPEGPEAMKSFGEGLVAISSFTVDSFVEAIGNAKEAIETAGSDMMGSFLDGLGDTTDYTSSEAYILMTSIMDEIVNYLTSELTLRDFKKAAAGIVSKCNDGLKEAKKLFTTTFESAITSLKVSLRDSYTSITAIGQTFARKFCEGFRSNYSSFYSAGKYAVTGLKNGINGQSSEAYDSGYNVAKEVSKGMADGLAEKSPSKETYKIGDYAVVGLVNSLHDGLSKAYSAGSDVSSSVLEGVKSAISNISQILENEVDTEPVIRPVIDDSGIQNGVQGIAAMFNNGSSFAVRGARTLSGNITARNVMLDANGNPIGTTYKFEQNNYSPKELSRLEVYRQTKNQFAMFANAKGAVPVR